MACVSNYTPRHNKKQNKNDKDKDKTKQKTDVISYRHPDLH